jgi:hypothetical protein
MGAPLLTAGGIDEKERVGAAYALSREVGEVKGHANDKKHGKESQRYANHAIPRLSRSHSGNPQPMHRDCVIRQFVAGSLS